MADKRALVPFGRVSITDKFFWNGHTYTKISMNRAINENGHESFFMKKVKVELVR